MHNQYRVFAMQLIDKLSILADAAKYDASCASSGAPKRSSEGKSGWARPMAWAFATATRRTGAACRC